MKYLFTVLLTILSFSSIYSQRSIELDIDILPVKNEDFPAWFIHKGDTVGLIFTIAQVQKIDSDLELLSWLEKKGFTCDSTISIYIKLVDDLEKQITILKTTVVELNKDITDKNSQINILKEKGGKYEEELKLANTEILKLNKVVTNSNQRITNLKLQRNLSIGGGVLISAAATLITYFILIR
jgi:peptidoglycan hydrolase CwlO-like protein